MGPKTTTSRLLLGKAKRISLYGFFSLLALILSLLLSPSRVQAHIPPPTTPSIGGEAPTCCRCLGVPHRCPEVQGKNGDAMSLTEGNLKQTYRVSALKSANGPTIDFTLTYNSYLADGSRPKVDTVMGFGWTHSYNIFLFKEGNRIFRMGADGRGHQIRTGTGWNLPAYPRLV